MAYGLGISDVSVVIPTEDKRIDELEKILEFLVDFGFEDIVLAHGDKQMYNRYESCAEAENPIIYTQDDDCLIHNIHDLLNAYRPERITANTKSDRIAYYEDVSNSKIALVGYGAIFHRDLIRNMQPYLDKYGEDSTLYREADRVFTWLNEKELIIADKMIQDFPKAYEGMSSNEPEHSNSMQEAIRRLKAL